MILAKKINKKNQIEEQNHKTRKNECIQSKNPKL